MNVKDKINKLQEKFNPEDYGIKTILDMPLTYSEKKGIILNMPPIHQQRGFDCLTSSIMASEILNNEGIASQVFTGPDQEGIWKNHAYLKVGEYIADFTPHYPTLGAAHPKGKLLSQEEIAQYSLPYNLSIIGASLPMKYTNGSTLSLGFDDYNESLIKLRKRNLPAFNIFLLESTIKDGKLNLKELDSCLATNVVGKTIRFLYAKIDELIPTR